MKLHLDPMPILRSQAEGRINGKFNSLAESHRDRIHVLKRAHGAAFRTGGEASDLLENEAELRGVTVCELVELIMSKPDNLSRREIARQKIMAQIDACTTPDELKALEDRVLAQPSF